MEISFQFTLCRRPFHFSWCLYKFPCLPGGQVRLSQAWDQRCHLTAQQNHNPVMVALGMISIIQSQQCCTIDHLAQFHRLWGMKTSSYLVFRTPSSPGASPGTIQYPWIYMDCTGKAQAFAIVLAQPTSQFSRGGHYFDLILRNTQTETSAHIWVLRFDAPEEVSDS